MVVAFGVAKIMQGAKPVRLPGEGKFVVAFGGAEFYKRYSLVRLPGEGLLFYEEK